MSAPMSPGFEDQNSGENVPIMVCPERSAMQFSSEASASFVLEAALCSEDCPGPVEVERHPLSPMRFLIGEDTKRVCPQSGRPQ